MAATGPALAQQKLDYLRYAFEQLTYFERRSLQVELQMAGLYQATVDGAYGPSTRRAIVSAPNFIRDNSQGRVTIAVETVSDLENFLRQIAMGEYSRWLYGEGNEGM